MYLEKTLYLLQGIFYFLVHFMKKVSMFLIATFHNLKFCLFYN